MPIRRVLVANRGEIAVRIVQGAHSLGVQAVAVYPQDDVGSRHVAFADEARLLPGVGVEAYLDIGAVVKAAVDAGCDSIHPGYGFLSESPLFARACLDAGLVFVGPSPTVLGTFGNKVSAREAARAAGLPVLAATSPGVDEAQARDFLASLGEGARVMVKAVAGGGGRGIRPVDRAEDLKSALVDCGSEALRAFGDDAVYVEEMMVASRHIEVQLLGDGTDVVDLGDRDCSLQRRRQKLVEIAPAPGLPDHLRERMRVAAVELGRSVGLSGVATVELLVDVASDRFVFLEVNPRVQVEHTVTEEVTGFDIVAAQLRIAGGALLADLPPVGRPEGFAVQVRLNAETVGLDGVVQPAAGDLTALDLPSGRGIRVDSAVTSGSTVSPRYDSLLAKIVVADRVSSLSTVLARVADTLLSVRVGGVATNIDLLYALVQRPETAAGTTNTTFLDTHLTELLSAPKNLGGNAQNQELDVVAKSTIDIPEGTEALLSPLPGVIVEVAVTPGSVIGAGATVLTIEAMKMEHVVVVVAAAQIDRMVVSVGDVVSLGQALAVIRPLEEAQDGATQMVDVDLDLIRPELAELESRLAVTRDENRSEAVTKRHRRGYRTARENLADLVDLGSFVEYGSLTIAAQRGRRALQDLIERTPADGLVCGVASVDGARCVVMAYDFSVLAGTQGAHNHRKQARLFELALRECLPVVIFAEGGGGRPGDTDGGFTTGLAEQTFARFAALSGTVPLISVVNGRCFAGNAALAGCSDVIIATRGASLGMSGPAMIEGGGLGVVAADDVGPMSVQVPNGVVDVLVEDEAEATRVAKRYLGYFTLPTVAGDHADQRLLRHLVPENRSRVYDVRGVVDVLADTGTNLELRSEYGVGIRTWLARVDGRAMGIVANNPLHLGGAIDASAADKMARFLQLCDAHGLPVVALCDTPGFMVGPEAERTASVRRFSRLFVVGAKMRVPICMVILRKGYGLGAMAMAGGSLHTPVLTVSWPTGELGPMGLEGGVRLGFRSELETISDVDDRERRFDELVADAYESGKAVNVASIFELDGVIDPAETRSVIDRVFGATNPERAERRGFVDTW